MRLIMRILSLLAICAMGYSVQMDQHRTLYVTGDENDQRSVQKRNTVTFYKDGEDEQAGFQTMELLQRIRRDARAAAVPESSSANKSNSSSSSTTKIPPLEDERKIIPKVTIIIILLLLSRSELQQQQQLFDIYIVYHD